MQIGFGPECCIDPLRPPDKPGVWVTKPTIQSYANTVCLIESSSKLMSQVGETALDAISKTQNEIKFAYVAFVGSWFCFLFMVHTMNRPRQSVSSWVLGGLAFAAVYAVIVGFVIRKKFFRQSAQALSVDLPKALKFWKVAHIIGFCCALDLALFGFALKFLGSSWLVPGIFFGLSLGFLLLWRPRELAQSGVQPA